MSAALCPNGHLSDTDDYCDQCGAKIGGEATNPAVSPPARAGTADPSAATALSAATGPEAAAPEAPPVGHVPCPACGAPNVDGDRFCEACGYDMTLGAPAAPPSPPAAPSASPSPEAAPSAASAAAPVPAASWTVEVRADRDYYDRLQADEIPFPAVYPERSFALTGGRYVVGRRSASRGITPEIDLSGAPEDPGVSHLHAVLVGTPESGWTIIDPGSANGTFLNDSSDALVPNTAIPLKDGDRVHIGAWTTLTLKRG